MSAPEVDNADDYDGEEEYEIQDIQSFVDVLTVLAGGMESKVEEHIRTQKQIKAFLKQVNTYVNGNDQDADDEEGEAERAFAGALRRQACMQEWVERVSSVLESDTEETKEQVFAERPPADEKDELDSKVNHDDSASQTFQDATPEQQAEMLETLSSLQTELQAMRQLQDQLAMLEGEEAEQQRQQAAAAEAVANAQQQQQAQDAGGDDDDEPPGLGVLQPNSSGTQVGSEGDAEGEAEVAALEEKLRQMQQLQQMLESLDPQAFADGTQFVDEQDIKQDTQPAEPEQVKQAVDDGTDSEANFNNMVDSLTEEEAQILQAKLSEYEQARREMEAQQQLLQQLQTEYAQLQQLEQLQQEQLAAQEDEDNRALHAHDQGREEQSYSSPQGSQEQQVQNDNDSAGISPQDDIGGGMADLHDVGESREEAEALLDYLTQQYTTLMVQRRQLEEVIAIESEQPGAEGSEQLAKMKATLSKIEDLCNNVSLYHTFISQKLAAQESGQ